MNFQSRVFRKWMTPVFANLAAAAVLGRHDDLRLCAKDLQLSGGGDERLRRRRRERPRRRVATIFGKAFGT